MTATSGVDHCGSFINSQFIAGGKPRASVERGVRRAVTISRQAGCGAIIVAEKLARLLQEQEDHRPWTVFDRDLMGKVLEDHNLPAHLAKLMPEDRASQLEDIVADVFETHPPSELMACQTTETILKLAGMGHVILIGRGGNVITARLPQVFHVRLVAPLDNRVAHAREFYSLTETEARRFCLTMDRGRERYLKRYFNADINDPLFYHLVINTGLVSYDEAAKWIAKAVLDLNPG